ncbi:fatty acid desaturase [Vibrio sp. TH_r3]|uniref:acyl-CoA desaturase n=1 Tax=Vibrio sp. TH_r3 TaxID=3082084 RepID=UPI002954AEFE|nr:fatty acid desaturase [Vibrio sp. TH_r3]MDV7103553.1 fatty acid desaturase [Vibrio sp. TH_r3]
MDISNKPPLIWLNVFVFALTAILALVAAPVYGYYQGYGWEHAIWLAIAYSFCNLSITAGYHRLWAHKAYQSHSALRYIYAIGGAFALQNSALHWASDHRPHHKFVDHTDKDPYAATRGFWYSHIGWMLRNYSEQDYDDYSNCRDLQKDNVVMWQHKHYLSLALLTNLGIPIVLGLIYQDVVGMLLIVGALRLFLSHHSTFFINSLAHIWGSQPYTTKNTARDNGFLAILTFGEGYHNFHHIFESDYRNGIHWWQYDPTKWLIKSCSWLGLATNLRVTPTLRIEKAKALALLSKVNRKLDAEPSNAQIKVRLQEECELLVKYMNDYYDIKKKLLEGKKETLIKHYEHSVLKVEYQQIKMRFYQQRVSWNQLVKQYA